MQLFTPRHSQPFTLEQAMLLEVDMLVAEVSRLQNSIARLGQTQDELRAIIADEPEADDDGELGKAVQENDETIASQTERIELIKVALLNKIGEGGLRHMGLTAGSGQDKASGAERASPASIEATAEPPGQTDPADEGIHL